MAHIGRRVLVILAIGGVACHSHGDILTGRDGGADGGGSESGVGGTYGGAGGTGGAARGTGGAAGGPVGAAAGTGGAAGSGFDGGAMGGAGVGGNLGAGTAFPNGIGPEWDWKTGVVAHTAGPYAPCGIIGSGTIIYGAANPTAPEIATASEAGIILFYSLETGRQVRPPYYAKGALHGVDYSRDGTKLVIAGDTGIQIVRLADREVLFSGQPFAFSAHAAALSPDGTLIAALGDPPNNDPTVFTLKLVRVSDGSSIGGIGPEAPDGVAPQFSADGKLLVVGDFILSVPGLEILPPSPLPFGNISPPHASLSPDGTKVADAGHVLDLASGMELKTPKLSDQFGVYWSAFSPDGAIYAETDYSIHLWRTSDWTPIGTPTPIAVPPGITVVSPELRFFFSGDGTRLIVTLPSDSVVGDQRVLFQIINVPDLSAGSAIAETGAGGTAVFSPDGSLVAASGSRTSGVWRTSDLSPLPRLPEIGWPFGFLGNGALQIDTSIFNPIDGTKLGSAIAYTYAVSPDGTLAVVDWLYPKSSVIRLADLKTQAVLDSSSFVSSAGPIWAFSRDNRVVAAAAPDGTVTPKVMVFDATTGTVLATLPGAAPIAIATTPSGAVRVAAFVPTANEFDTDVRVWSVPDGTPLFDIVQASPNDQPPPGLPMDFSPDGSLIATGSPGIRIFQVETGALRETLPAHFTPATSGPYTGVSSIAFSATGQIASMGWDGTTRFWCSP